MNDFSTPMTRQVFWQEFDKCRGDLDARLLLHMHYHGQIVEATGIRPSENLLDMCRQAAQDGDNWALNKVPLRLWDAEAEFIRQRIAPALRAIGDGYSLGVAVCVLKESARRILAAEGIELPRR